MHLALEFIRKIGPWVRILVLNLNSKIVINNYSWRESSFPRDDLSDLLLPGRILAAQDWCSKFWTDSASALKWMVLVLFWFFILQASKKLNWPIKKVYWLYHDAASEIYICYSQTCFLIIFPSKREVLGLRLVYIIVRLDLINCECVSWAFFELRFGNIVSVHAQMCRLFFLMLLARVERTTTCILLLN
jgi:hypothetical protein